MWLINLVENILFITRIENKTMKINLQTELLDDIINEALKHLYRRGKNHHIVFKEIKDIMMVKVDARLLVQVFINIIDNAIKYTPSGGSVMMNVDELPCDKPGYMIVRNRVSDTGIGISQDYMTKILMHLHVNRTLQRAKLQELDWECR